MLFLTIWCRNRVSMAREAPTQAGRIASEKLRSSGAWAWHPADASQTTLAGRDDREFTETLAEVVSCIEQRSDYRGAVRVTEVGEDGLANDRLALKVAQALADANPEWAASFAAALPAESLQAAAMTVAAEGMTHRYAGQALDWVMAMPAGLARSAALERVVSILVNRDISSAGEIVTALPSSLVRDESMCAYAACWTCSDPMGAVGWADTIADEIVKTKVLASIGLELAESGQGATQRLIDQLRSPSDRTLLQASVLWSEQLLRTDTATAARK